MFFFALLALVTAAPAFACSPGDMQDCTVPHGSGYKNCATGTWSYCVVAMCDFGYYIGGIAENCTPIGGPSGASTKTVTVTATSTGTGTRPATSAPAPPATSALVSTSGSEEGVAQRDAYCRSASLDFLSAVNLLKQGHLDAGLAAYAQGQETLRRAQTLGNGGCDSGTLENYLSADNAAKAATAQVAATTGLKPKALAEYTHEEAARAGTAREPTPAAGLRALVKSLPPGTTRSDLLAALDKTGSANPKTNTDGGTASETKSPEPAVTGDPGSTAPTPSSGAATPEFAVPEAPAKPSVPTRSKENDSTLSDLKALDLLLYSAAAGEGEKAVEEKLRDFSLFTRVRARYRAREGTFGGPPLGHGP
jgi:hypothetical protein